jgi:hypothetical protein
MGTNPPDFLQQFDSICVRYSGNNSRQFGVWSEFYHWSEVIYSWNYALVTEKNGGG